MTSSARPIPGLKALVVENVRDRIFGGELQRGEKIDQDELTRVLGISKIPVREALITLESAGLIVNEPRRGAYVAELTQDDILDTFRLAGAVSAMAARQAAVTMTKADILELESLVAQMRKARTAAKYAPLNDLFHARIHRAGSRRLRSMLRSLSDGIPSRFFEATRGWHELADVEHNLILDALRSKDPDAAYVHTIHHFERNGELAVQLLNKANFWAPRAS